MIVMIAYIKLLPRENSQRTRDTWAERKPFLELPREVYAGLICPKIRAVPLEEQPFRPGGRYLHANGARRNASLTDKVGRAGAAMNCQHRFRMKFGGMFMNYPSARTGGLPVRQQKSACYGIPKMGCFHKHSAYITSAIHNSRFGGIPIFATILYTKGEKWVILCLHGAAMPLLMEIGSP